MVLWNYIEKSKDDFKLGKERSKMCYFASENFKRIHSISKKSVRFIYSLCPFLLRVVFRDF